VSIPANYHRLTRLAINRIGSDSTMRQGAKIAPHLPANQRGPRRKDDRLILSGIMQVPKVGCRWVDCPKVHGLHKAIDNRFARGSLRGIWQRIFAAALSRPLEQTALGCHHGKVHRCASGGEGGPNSRRPGLPPCISLTGGFIRRHLAIPRGFPHLTCLFWNRMSGRDMPRFRGLYRCRRLILASS
jgi:transposase